MLQEEKLIYSQRFPHFDPATLDLAAPDDEKDPPPIFSEEIFDYLERTTVFTPVPEKIAGKGEFIALAERLSREERIDMDIKEHPYYITVDMHLGFYPYGISFREMLIQLLKLCDSLYFFPGQIMPDSFMISLEYFTHDHHFER